MGRDEEAEMGDSRTRQQSAPPHLSMAGNYTTPGKITGTTYRFENCSVKFLHDIYLGFKQRAGIFKSRTRESQ